jgi:DNA polymerase-3 subunit gamma/tau
MSDSDSPAEAYRVLARKYRPQGFDALLGQDAMVRTLANAIARGRLAHAFLLTGVRGVGKTSTARLLAKALNCVGPDGSGGPTIDPCGQCEPCVAIAESRHIDVIEMDAASRTGVDDVREIIDAARYAAVSARYKIYIIDEVHMLTRNAFNALLKTLEEPPGHVKFIFATTEIQKVPVTVLSRCQRFDLRRIPADALAAHFGGIAAKEGAEVEAEAMALIARAAEGSVRDGLSILDQAIAHGHGRVAAADVRDMLGLSDRGRSRALMDLLIAGDAAGALANLAEQYALGTGPDAAIEALLELTHATTRTQAAGTVDPALAEAEREAVTRWAAMLSAPALHRLWQLLLRGLAETRAASMPLQAAEMALLRIVHASSLPDPGDLVRRLLTQPADEQPARPTGSAPPPAAPPRETVAANAARGLPGDFRSLVALFERNKEPVLEAFLHDHCQLVRFAPPVLEINAGERVPADFASRVTARLAEWTGTRWTIGITTSPGQPSLRAQTEARQAAERARVLADAGVRAVFAAFPEAELVGYELDDTAADETARNAG